MNSKRSNHYIIWSHVNLPASAACLCGTR